MKSSDSDYNCSNIPSSNPHGYLFNVSRNIDSYDSFTANTDKSKKSDLTITRTFALRPTDNPHETYSKLSYYFNLLRDYKNYCSRALTEYFVRDPQNHLSDFNVSYKKASQSLYRDTLHLNHPLENRSEPQFFELKDRSRLMGFYDSFIAVQNLIV